ncbi:hypothetical protein EBU60_06555, partial [bacterium]|nr:hypothetical protein [bacterium]
MATPEQVKAAIAAAKGQVFTLVAKTKPTPTKVLIKRAEIAEKNAVDGVAFSAQQTLATEEVDGGTISVVRVSGRPDPAWGGGDPLRVNKKGEVSLGFVISAMNEYGNATACPNAGVEGTACVDRGERHSHRAYGV